MLRISKNKGIPFLFIFILILILGKLTFSNLYDYLTKEIQVNSKILVLEGWLPSNAVEEAAKVFIQDEYQYLIVVGSNYRIDPTICKNTPDRTRKTSEYRLNKNGYLKVNPKWLDKLTITDSIYTVIITAKGSEVMRVTAFFYLVINNKIIGKSFTTKEYLNYPFTWHNNQKSITNLYILYTNDVYVLESDRNLYVSGIQFGLYEVPLSDTVVAYIHPSKKSVKPEIVAFPSLAESTGSYLVELGISKDKLYIIPSEFYKLNKTISNAKSFASWISQSPFHDKPINIFTYDIHSRRTYSTFKSKLPKETEIGTIVYPNLTYTKSNWWKSHKGIKYFMSELFSCIIASIFSLF